MSRGSNKEALGSSNGRQGSFYVKSHTLDAFGTRPDAG